jgi:hypothetical protein
MSGAISDTVDETIAMLDLDISLHKLEIQVAQRTKRMLRLSGRIVQLDKSDPHYLINKAELMRNIAAVQLDVARIEVRIAEVKTEINASEREAVASMMGGLADAVFAGPFAVPFDDLSKLFGGGDMSMDSPFPVGLFGGSMPGFMPRS